MKYLSCLVVLMIFTIALFASGNSVTPDSSGRLKGGKSWYVPMQFAGNLGFISTGIGLGLNRPKMQFGILYGYVPRSLANVNVHLASMKVTIQLFTVKSKMFSVLPYAGLAPSLELGGNSFIRLPSKFPRRYYRSNALHVAFLAGLKFRTRSARSFFIVRDMELFVETGTMDTFLFYKFVSADLSLGEIFSAAAGINFFLR